MVKLNRFQLTIVAGILAGLAGGLATSLTLFGLFDFGNLTTLGFVVLVVVRGVLLGAGGGGFAALLCVVKTRPFGAPAAALAGAICGSLAIFLPIPFHLPNEVMDLLAAPDARISP